MKMGKLGKLLIILALPLLSYWSSNRYLVDPLEFKTEQLASELSQLRQQKLALLNQQKLQVDGMEEFEQLTKKVAMINPQIPPKEQVTHLIAKLPTMAKQSQVIIEEVRYQPFTSVNQDYQLLEFTMPVVGSYANIREFIYQLEKMPTRLAIDELSLKQHKQKGMLSLELSLSSFYQKP